ncbi:hypothetical protein K438DRAFT_774236 [Mycena galopus ATCC 62051]|nr:hypothetical protein K438DRAFT_774236 [Mycena galopus ATCC 62051]
MTSRYRWKLLGARRFGAGTGNALADFLFVQFADVASHALEEINANKCGSAPPARSGSFRQQIMFPGICGTAAIIHPPSPPQSWAPARTRFQSCWPYP